MRWIAEIGFVLMDDLFFLTSRRWVESARLQLMLGILHSVKLVSARTTNEVWQRLSGRKQFSLQDRDVSVISRC
jgi:hypothetical protein